jgi:single-strand DNA-binding protein
MPDTDADTAAEPVNHVTLRGRLADPPVERELPSGDILVTFRLTVPRPAGDRVRVDSIDCVASAAGVRRVLGRAAAGEELELEGSLRRRFWRSPNGPASRYAVEASAVRRTATRAGRRGGASRARTRASA